MSGKNQEIQVAIVGNGCAAVECVKALRGSGCAGAVHVFSDISSAPYNPMLVTYYAGGKIDYEKMFPYGSQEHLCQVYDVEFHGSDPVVSLDAASHLIQTAGGVSVNYGQCLVATGATPFIPFKYPDTANLRRRILTVRTLADAERLKDLLAGEKQRVLVVGASMIGIKVVEALKDKGFAVCYADLAEHVFCLSTHESCSCMIETQLRRKGVRLRFGTTITTVEEAADGSCLIGFDDGGPQEIADYLVVCVGVRPNVSFLDRQQVRMDRGILVDETMRTNCEDLYAAGDVTQGGDLLSGEQRIIGLWANARLQGRTAGLNMAGCWTRYPGTVPHNITHFMDIDLVSAGDVLKGDTVYEDMDADRYTYCRFVWTAGRLTGFNLLNMPQVSGILKNHLIKGLVTEKNLLSYLTQDTLIMNKLYQKFPGLEKVFTSMEAH